MPDTLPRSLYDYPAAELASLLEECGAKPYRVRQVHTWLWAQGVSDPAQMSNLPAALRTALTEQVAGSMLTLEAEHQSADGSKKIVWRLGDGQRIETVWMPNTDGRLTLCLSSQVGCALGCTFCATGTMGLVRQLTVGEYIEQVLQLQRLYGRRPENIVLMGMGEALHNRTQLEGFLNALGDPAGYAFSLTRVTLSTVGLMDDLATFNVAFPQVNLAISLVSPFDATRTELMPINKRFDVAAIAAAIKALELGKGARVTLEYPLIRALNDRPEDAREVVRVFGGCKVKVNLIPYNTTAHATFARPELERIEAFQTRLKAGGIPAFIRWSKGQDVGAACGQLVTV